MPSTCCSAALGLQLQLECTLTCLLLLLTTRNEIFCCASGVCSTTSLRAAAVDIEAALKRDHVKINWKLQTFDKDDETVLATMTKYVTMSGTLY